MGSSILIPYPFTPSSLTEMFHDATIRSYEYPASPPPEAAPNPSSSSTTTTFDIVVAQVEQFLLHSFQTHPILSTITEQGAAAAAAGASSPSMAEGCSGPRPPTPVVLSAVFPHPTLPIGCAAIRVELHFWNWAHVIAKKFGLPLFLLSTYVSRPGSSVPSLTPPPAPSAAGTTLDSAPYATVSPTASQSLPTSGSNCFPGPSEGSTNFNDNESSTGSLSGSPGLARAPSPAPLPGAAGANAAAATITSASSSVVALTFELNAFLSSVMATAVANVFGSGSSTGAHNSHSKADPAVQLCHFPIGAQPRPPASILPSAFLLPSSVVPCFVAHRCVTSADSGFASSNGPVVYDVHRGLSGRYTLPPSSCSDLRRAPDAWITEFRDLPLLLSSNLANTSLSAVGTSGGVEMLRQLLYFFRSRLGPRAKCVRWFGAEGGSGCGGDGATSLTPPPASRPNQNSCCVSLRKRYRLHFQRSSDAPLHFSWNGWTYNSGSWEELLTAYNHTLQKRCGETTHSFGVTPRPVEFITFWVSWNQLGEAALTSSPSALDPFSVLRHSKGSSQGAGGTGTAATSAADGAAFLPDCFSRPPISEACTIKAMVQVLKRSQLEHHVGRSVQPLLRWLLKVMEGAVALAPLMMMSGGVDDVRSSSFSSAGDDRQSRGGGGDEAAEERDRARHQAVHGVMKLPDKEPASQLQLVMELWNSRSPEAALQSIFASRSSAFSQCLPVATARTPSMCNSPPSLPAPAAAPHTGKTKGKKAAPLPDDIRLAYLPSSLLCRVAFHCASVAPLCLKDPSGGGQMLLEVWINVIEALEILLQPPLMSSQLEQLLSLLGLPPPLDDAPVDLTKSLLVQKLQFLAYCVKELLLKFTHESIPVGLSLSFTQSATSSLSYGAETTSMTLITNSEPLLAPPTLRRPVTTSDILLLSNTLPSLFELKKLPDHMLQRYGVFSDMCLFRFVNDGREVRFPDFIQWMSPRDFQRPAETASAPAAAGALDDNAFLSERMKIPPRGTDEEEGVGSGRRSGSSPHVGHDNKWWYLWQRSTPISPLQIQSEWQQSYDQEARDVLTWLRTEVTQATLAMELSMACLANATHPILIDPRVISSTHPLQDFFREKCRRIHASMAPVHSLLLRDAAITGIGGSSLTHKDVADMQMCFEDAVGELFDAETSLCVAIEIDETTGRDNRNFTSNSCISSLFTSSPECVSIARELMTPLQPQPADSTERLHLSSAVVSLDAWKAGFAQLFERKRERMPLDCCVRMTCMAERPEGTAPGFQQLIVIAKESGALQLSLSLSKAVV